MGCFFFKKYLPLITWLLFQDPHVFDQKWDSLAHFWEAEAKRCPALLCSTAAAAAWSLDSLKALSDNMWHCYEDVLNVKPRVLYRNWEMWLTQWHTKHCFAFMSGQLWEHKLQKFRAAGAARSRGQKGVYKLRKWVIIPQKPWIKRHINVTPYLPLSPPHTH